MDIDNSDEIDGKRIKHLIFPYGGGYLTKIVRGCVCIGLSHTCLTVAIYNSLCIAVQEPGWPVLVKESYIKHVLAGQEAKWVRCLVN